uniref:Uncharacterized protein n=1 Tax=Romanomermis culicivorax TaxID=13658 RepID=A0A915I9X3_ROMCU
MKTKNQQNTKIQRISIFSDLIGLPSALVPQEPSRRFGATYGQSDRCIGHCAQRRIDASRFVVRRNTQKHTVDDRTGGVGVRGERFRSTGSGVSEQSLHKIGKKRKSNNLRSLKIDRKFEVEDDRLQKMALVYASVAPFKAVLEEGGELGGRPAPLLVSNGQ